LEDGADFTGHRVFATVERLALFGGGLFAEIAVSPQAHKQLERLVSQLHHRFANLFPRQFALGH